VIRQATADDAPDLAKLHAEAFAEPWSEAAVRELAATNGAFAFTGDDGFILARAIGSEAEILTLAVKPSARRRGLGQALVQAAAAGAREAGAGVLFLEVAADNAAAIALYARCGFEPMARRAAYYRRRLGPPMDALVLRKTLTSAPA